MNRAENNSEVAEKKRKIFNENAPAYLNKLFETVFSRTQDRDLADEISQQAIVKYWSQMEKENWQLEIKDEEAYLIRIARFLLMERNSQTLAVIQLIN